MRPPTGVEDPEAEFARLLEEAPPMDGGTRRAESAESPPAAAGAVEITAADVRARPIRWHWRWRLAAGKLTLLDGDPDVGKSLALVDLSARVTTGREMPDGSPGLGAPRSVIVIAAFEDALDDTWIPRFVAAGGDRDRLIFLRAARDGGKERPLVFPGDRDLLKARILHHEAALVVCDAVMHLLPERANPFSTKDCQRYLHPIAERLAETDAAMIANRHYSKGQGRTALEKGQGSASLIGVARVALALVRDPDRPNQEGGRLLGFGKGNIVPDSERVSLKLRIGEVSRLLIDGSEHDRVPMIEWEGADPRSVDDVLAVTAAGDPAERTDAREAILDVLAGESSLLGKELERRVTDYGVGRHRFEAARSELRREGLIDRRQPGKEDDRGRAPVEWFLTPAGEALICSPTPPGEGGGGANTGGANPSHNHAGSEHGDGFGPPAIHGRGSKSPEAPSDADLERWGELAGGKS